MKKSRYTESQIVKALKEVEGGRNVKDLCREMGILEATYYCNPPIFHLRFQ